jgi:hypothetical protein
VKAQNHLLALALMVPNLRDFLQPLSTDMLPDEKAQQLFTFLREHPDFDGSGKGVATLKNLADYSKMLGVIFEELYQNLEVIELRYEATRLQVRLIEHYVKNQKQALTQELRTADETRSTELLTKAKALDALLNVTKEGDA